MLLNNAQGRAQGPVQLEVGAGLPSPFIVGVPGTVLDDETRQVLADLKPAGFILFKRNCESAAQVKALCDALYALSPFDPPLIFIDQEGGRVNRILWEGYMAPAGRVFGQLYAEDPAEGLEAARLNGFVLGAQLKAYGITVNCLPLADIAFPETDEVIGDRAFSDDPQTVAALCGATISGLMAGGVWPVIKHAPGHGRAQADSHKELPVVQADLEELKRLDFYPFQVNNACPFVMTAHILYPQLDARACATCSPAVVEGLLRETLGMTGLIVSDDINMNALEGDIRARARAALDGGCDLILHCSGKLDEMRELVGVATLSDAALDRLQGLPVPAPVVCEQTVAEAKVRLKALIGREDA